MKVQKKTFCYKFRVQYNPGKWNRRADSMSHNPVNAKHNYSLEIIANSGLQPSQSTKFYTIEDHILKTVHLQIYSITEGNPEMVSYDKLKQTMATDPDMTILRECITNGFPRTRSLLAD